MVHVPVAVVLVALGAVKVVAEDAKAHAEAHVQVQVCKIET